VHCVSRFEADLVRRDFRREPVIIQNGIAEDAFRFKWEPPDTGLVIMYAGRLEKYKRVKTLVEAASLVSKAVSDVTLRIVGDGPELQNILGLGQKLHLDVEHHNFLSRQEYLKLLSTSTFFVNLSEYEAFSIVVAEAVAIGLSVFAALPWGMTFKNCNNVSLVAGGSPNEVAERMLNVLKVKPRKDSQNNIMRWPTVTRMLVEKIYYPLLTSKNSISS